MAAAYAYRPPYPAELFDTLEELIVDEARAVLDIGARDGALARPLAERVDRVNTVEISAAMVKAGRRRPGGQSSNLTWLVEPAERMTAGQPYDLVTADASLHWMDPTTSLLAIVDQQYHQLPWQYALVKLIAEQPATRPTTRASHSRLRSPSKACSTSTAGGRPNRWHSPNPSATTSNSFTQPHPWPAS